MHFARLTGWLRAVHTPAYLAAKGTYLGPFSVFATFIAALFVISNVAWDYAIDPANMGGVVWIRLLEAASVFLLAAVMRANPTGLPARVGLFVVPVFVQVTFIEILRQLDGGASYGIGAFLYFFIFVPFMAQAQSLRFNVVLLGCIALLPNLLIGFGYGTHLDLGIYNAYMLMAYGPVVLILTLIEYLVYQAHKEHGTLKRDAETDALTNLPNRRCFLRVGKEMMERATMARESVSVVFIDVDHFKSINDQHGHLRGDHILQQIADRIERCTRVEDLVCRFGGEEFVAVMPCANVDTARRVARRICEQVAERPFHGSDETATPIYVTVSIGLASAAPDQGSFSLQGLTRRADDAAYAAKSAGRNRVETHKDTLSGS